jgi:hypothetical protein
MIAPTLKARLNDPEVQAAFNYHQARLRALFDGAHLDPVFVLNGIGMYTEDVSLDWEAWLDESLAILATRAEDACNREIFRPLTITYNPHGVHFVDKLFGAEVFVLDGSWQVRPFTTPVGTLQAPDLATHPTWRAVRDFAQAFMAREVTNVTLGLPTIASVLNIAVNLYGQEILLAMVTEPEAAHHDLQIISDVLCALHRWFMENIPPERYQCIIPDQRFQLPGYGQLCGCTTQLVSRQTYADFVAPLDDALLSQYPHGGMIHLCGSHLQHLPTWKALPSFRAFQINDRAAEDLDGYFHGLRDDQIMYVNIFPGMTFERTMDITGGRRVVIVGNLERLPSEA